MPEDKSVIMSVEEAAVVLGIGRQTAYRAARDGQLPVIRIGKRLLIPRKAFQEMLDGKWRSRDARK